MQVLRLSVGPTLLLIAAFGLGGCAWQTAESDLRIAVAEHAPAEDGATPARSERTAEAKKVPRHHHRRCCQGAAAAGQARQSACRSG